MKKVFIIICILCLFNSCKKAKINSELTGTWKLVRMYNETNGTSVLPPSYATRFAGITFQSNGSFYGNTLMNTISDGSYVLEGTNKIQFKTFSSTKVYEDEWGRNFIEVLMSCYLQSLSPCIQPTYLINGNQLTIYSVTSYDLIFEKE
jgi:heat shock protein HslJ